MKNIPLIIDIFKNISIWILSIIILASCSEDIPDTMKQSAPQKVKTMQEIISDPEFPSLYEPAEKYENYFDAVGQAKWLSSGTYSEVSIIHINEASPHLFDRRKTYDVIIKAQANEWLSNLSFSEAKSIAINLLPKYQPLKKEYAEKLTTLKLNFTMETERSFLVYRNEKPTIIYSAKFISSEKQPTLGDIRGGSQYYESIGIHISKSGIEKIAIGGGLSAPGMRERSIEIDTISLDDKAKWVDIIALWNK